jgi:hypothetical protein
VSGFAQWLQTTSVSVTIQSVKWIIPLLQSIHILTIGIVFVSSLMIALRVLGRVRADEPFDTVWRRFAPWMWSGLVVMTVTGLTLVVGEPVREFTTLSFWLKMTLLAIGVTSTAVLGHSLRPVALGSPRMADVSSSGAAVGTLAASSEFSAASKAGAVALVVIWLAIIFLGRAIAYDDEVWGHLSLHS